MNTGTDGSDKFEIPIPSEADWRSEPWCLDAQHAYKQFSGKSHATAVAMFRDNAILYQEDVMFMPAACVPFYFAAYADYLLSAASVGDSDGASCMFSVIGHRLDEILAAGPPTTTLAEKVLERLASKQSSYDASEGIYGDFSKRAAPLLARLRGG